jgi:predicted CXXCH cytochrome family protein
MKIITTIFLILFCIVLFYCCVEYTRPENKAAITYAGTEKCQSCHAKEYNSYTGSDHFHAMDSALPRSVKGNFSNSFFVYDRDTSFFYQSDGRYYVRTRDSLGRRTEFMVSYTFGWKPLQQYLVRFEDGRIQALPFCWDTRTKEQGGQRWFHIYGKEKILPGDELFWTGTNQNWNNMCADCHTTNYFKNFDVTDNSFHSTWSESKVSCESCHGPASGHIAWSEKKDMSDSLKGFAINLSGKKTNWKFNTGKGIAYPDEIVENTTLIETCARCHARASRISDNYYHGQSFLQTHIPSVIDTANYYIDGQIKAEDYEYGSFLQSRMYAMGVTCINCHDAHSMQLKAPGNAVCASCHAPEKFDVEAHTFHQANSKGSQCVSCHMPTTTYMGIDDRLDHSIRIPRPDLSLALGTPNACNRCHKNETVSWAAKYFSQWYGHKLPANNTYGQLMHTLSKSSVESEAAFYSLLSSNTYPAIIKATALEQYSQFASPRNSELVKSYLQSNDPNLRLNALHAVSGLPAELILSLVIPLLNDPVLTVRTEAMNALAPLYAQLDGLNKQRFDQVLNEYLGIQRNICDRPEGFLNQGIVLTATGGVGEAEQLYLQGLKRFPKFIPLYANTADLYRSLGNETRSKEYLQAGLLLQPGNAMLHYSLGLWYVRSKDNKTAMRELQKAIQLNPSDASFVYAYAIGLYTKGDSQQAIHMMQAFLSKYGNNPLIINGLLSLYQDMKQTDKVDYYTELRKQVYGY